MLRHLKPLKFYPVARTRGNIQVCIHDQAAVSQAFMRTIISYECPVPCMDLIEPASVCLAERPQYWISESINTLTSLICFHNLTLTARL